MDLLNLDTLEIVLLVAVVIIVLYFLIRWWRKSGTWRQDDSEVHGCLNVLWWVDGCTPGCLVRAVALAGVVKLVGLLF